MEFINSNIYLLDLIQFYFIIIIVSNIHTNDCSFINDRIYYHDHKFIVMVHIGTSHYKISSWVGLILMFGQIEM